MGWAGCWSRVLAAPYPFLSAAPPCPPSNASTELPTGACSDRVPPRRPCQCPTSQYQEDPSQKLLSIVHPSKAIVTMGCLTLAFQRKKAEVQLELWKLWRCKKRGGGGGGEVCRDFYYEKKNENMINLFFLYIFVNIEREK